MTRRLLLPDLLRAAAAAAPDDAAVVDGTRSLTWAALDRRSNALARVLVDRGVGPGDRVALFLDKSLESLLAIYGILKAGAVYVPLDAAAPARRLGFIARDAGVDVCCTSAARARALAGLVEQGAPFRTALVLDAADPEPGDDLDAVSMVGREAIDAADDRDTSVRRIGEDLAYILYTSGSTGDPKGVMLSHRAALAFVHWAVDTIGVTSDDRLSSHAPLHFDLSIFDLFAAASVGAPVHLVPPKASRFPVEIRRFIEDAGITVWYSVPSILTMLALRGGLEPASMPTLRTVLFAGEVFPTAHLRALMQQLPRVEFWNLYGPTETNVCTAYRVPEPPEGDEPVPIGRAITDDETFVVGDDGHIVTPGDVGMLYVRGGTVMSGYWNDPERTARTLAPSRWHAPLRDLAYCTGDLVRELPGGDYEFLGRKDLQIKSRGYRIELGEIETALHAHPAVLEAAVVAVPDDLVGNRLHAFVSTRAQITERELLGACKSRLPSYMVPECLEILDALPKTSSGKLDRQTLTTAAASRRTAHDAEQDLT